MATNQDSPSGFTCIGTLDGSDYHGKAQRVALLAADSTATFVGDTVKITGTASADGTTPSVAQCAAGDRPYGVLVSLEPNFEDESSLSTANYRVASTLRYGMVIPMDAGLFAIQEDSVGGDLAITNVGQNISVVVGAGSTATGISGMEIDSSTAATTNTLVYRIMGVHRVEDNELGTNCQWVVTSNLTNLNNITGV